MARGKAVFRASTRSARRVGHELSAAGRRIQPILIDTFAGLSRDALRITRAYAPHRSGRLERGLKARVRSYGGRVVVEVVSEARSDTGYDYLPVTRFGHRAAFIFPVKAKALRFYVGGQLVFRRFVRGYRPTRDWVDDAFRAVEIELDRASAEIGRKIDRTVSP